MTSKVRSTHEQSRARNNRFAEIAQSPEVRNILDCIPKSTHVSYLRKLCEEKYGFVVPPSAAYKVMSTIDNRFKPKTRQMKTSTPTFAAEPTDFVQPRISGTAEHSD